MVKLKLEALQKRHLLTGAQRRQLANLSKIYNLLSRQVIRIIVRLAASSNPDQETKSESSHSPGKHM
ncbi:hypothetical protein CRH12_03075 [Coxiella burnetii]|nr:hypothetical protein CRH12_03075 [Coxiella burnetii]